MENGILLGISINTIEISSNKIFGNTGNLF